MSETTYMVWLEGCKTPISMKGTDVKTSETSIILYNGVDIAGIFPLNKTIFFIDQKCQQ